MTQIPPAATAAAWYGVAAGLGMLMVGLVAYHLGFERGEQEAEPSGPFRPVLTPPDDDERKRTNQAYIATVQYGATGNTDRLVILDAPHVDGWIGVKDAIEAQVDGAEVIDITTENLYAAPATTID